MLVVTCRPALPRRRLLASTAAGLLLGGCAVGPDYQAPAAPGSQRFTEQQLPTQTVSTGGAGGAAQRFDQGRDIPADWWALFHSQQITDLVTLALKSNPDLAAAQATLRQAQENVRAAQGSLFPQVGFDAQWQRQAAPTAQYGVAGGRTLTYTYDSYNVNVSYTLDLFGGVRRQIEQLDAKAEYQHWELVGADLTLAANVVNAALTEASLRAQIATTEDIIRIAKEALSLTQQRFALGAVSQADVLQQQALVDQQVATLPALQKQLQQQRNQIAVYLGGRPDGYSMATLDLNALTLPEDLPVSLPSKLVEQRPDIRAYAALLHAASAGVGVAIANMLPQVTLSGAYGRGADNFSNLFTPEGIAWSIASAITQPIFKGGTLNAQRRAALDALDVAAAQYSSTVNVAFQNVADALVAIERDAEALQAAVAAQKTADASLSVAQTQYRAGGGTYLNVLTAQQSAFSARLSVTKARATRFSDTVALFQALGGGWWNLPDTDTQLADASGAQR
ncbi:efflux transporter outer membrane subunit [Rhodopila sp.]|jgi:NodT family efflux transporter outer membrane factor (OMF) lipoprotein|uniref:efflux transporter outer membrane subunit n=1 Tax=Rhodopila sp. TaxID=2480087 RepID=UPI002B6961EA|nr:efflux transporter outer membrane subunit [Rhodopila sp.]HVZ10199.1 efflux transporter outer membrane subunit [Rhodopila sp.]